MNQAMATIKKQILLLLFILPNLAIAQKALQIEKRGSMETRKIFIGDQLIYKLHNDRRFWLEEVITEIHIEDGFLEFENRIVHIDSIYAIKEAAGRGARPVSLALKGFGLSWTFWTTVSILFSEENVLLNYGIGGGSYLLGELLKVAFFKTHKFKGRKRLRLIDLTFEQKTIDG